MGGGRMVITFTSDTAFEQLRDCGAVTTFRATERKRTPRHGAQATWVARGRGEPKEFDCEVRFLAEVRPTVDHLGWYAGLSGFPSPEAWVEKIHEYHGNEVGPGFVYIVTTPKRGVFPDE